MSKFNFLFYSFLCFPNFLQQAENTFINKKKLTFKCISISRTETWI